MPTFQFELVVAPGCGVWHNIPFLPFPPFRTEPQFHQELSTTKPTASTVPRNQVQFSWRRHRRRAPNLRRIQPGISERRQAARGPHKVPIRQRPFTPHENPIKPQRLGRIALVRRSQKRDCSIRRRRVHAFAGVNRTVVRAEDVPKRVTGGVVEGHWQEQGDTFADVVVTLTLSAGDTPDLSRSSGEIAQSR